MTGVCHAQLLNRLLRYCLTILSIPRKQGEQRNPLLITLRRRPIFTVEKATHIFQFPSLGHEKDELIRRNNTLAYANASQTAPASPARPVPRRPLPPVTPGQADLGGLCSPRQARAPGPALQAPPRLPRSRAGRSPSRGTPPPARSSAAPLGTAGPPRTPGAHDPLRAAGGADATAGPRPGPGRPLVAGRGGFRPGSSPFPGRGFRSFPQRAGPVRGAPRQERSHLASPEARKNAAR